MNLLLLGEYSNVHATLAQGLRALGHQVTLISDGDRWKNYPRDIDLTRRSTHTIDTLRYLLRCARIIPRLRGYDIVQLINPIFLDLRANKILPFYNTLRRHNRKIILCAFGMDHYWVKTCLDAKTFRYSDFNIGTHLRTHEPCAAPFIRDWLQGPKANLNIHIAQDADHIVTGLYEYDACYRPHFPTKTTYIPFPINIQETNPSGAIPTSLSGQGQGERLSFFIGIQATRSQYKGTDIMLRALQRLQRDYPTQVQITQVQSLPYAQYIQLLSQSQILLDQLYSYTPAMNALAAMAKGLVVVGGGEPENYQILHEDTLRPIVNVLPTEEDVYHKLQQLVLHPQNIPTLARQSIQYIQKHHDHIKVAQQYQQLYNQLLKQP